MSNIIDSIQLSGTVYTIQGTGGGGSPTVELTQAEYNALVSAGTVSANTYYIITDAYSPDISSITSAVTSGSTDSEIPTAKAVYDAISSGGTTYSAGRAIDITNNTISLDLSISAGTGNRAIAEGHNTAASGNFSHAEGYSAQSTSNSSHAEGYRTSAMGDYAHSEGYQTIASGDTAHAEGYDTTAGGWASHTEGRETIANNDSEHASGKYNISNTGNSASAQTLFSVGNGTADDARHNAFEIRQNGDIYFNDGTSDVKLQDKFSTIETTIGDINTLLSQI